MRLKMIFRIIEAFQLCNGKKEIKHELFQTTVSWNSYQSVRKSFEPLPFLFASTDMISDWSCGLKKQMYSNKVEIHIFCFLKGMLFSILKSKSIYWNEKRSVKKEIVLQVICPIKSFLSDKGSHKQPGILTFVSHSSHKGLLWLLVVEGMLE